MKKKIYVLVGLLSLIFIGLIIFIFITFLDSFDFSAVDFTDTKELSEIAGRFQTTPSWDAIFPALNHSFKPGMTRKEVHKILDLVGHWEIEYSDPEDAGQWDWETNQTVYRENVQFTDKYTYHFIGSWGFYYDKNGILVDQRFIDTGF